jgi:hypothetical protein
MVEGLATLVAATVALGAPRRRSPSAFAAKYSSRAPCRAGARLKPFGEFARVVSARGSSQAERATYDVGDLLGLARAAGPRLQLRVVRRRTA